LLVLLFAAGAAADWLLPESDRQAHRARRVLNLLALGLCLLAASLLNPNTYRVLLYPLFLTSSATFTGSIMELQSPLLPLFRGSDFVVALALLLLVGLASFILNRARRPSHLLLFAAFGAAGLLSLRNLPLFAITAVPLVGFNLRDVVPGRAGPRARAALLTGILLASAALLARTLLVGTRLPGGFRRPGLGIARATFPADAAEFVSRNRVKGNVLNTMEFGGYLIWRWHPARRVFTDGRLDVYGPTFFERYSRALWSTATFDSLAAEHNISCAVLAWPPRFDGSTVRYVGRTLALRPGWSLVHWDDVALVYVRANSVDSALARREGYASVAPFLLWPGPADTPAVENLVAETRRAVASVPGSTRTHTALGWALLRSRDVSAASNEFSLALAINPRSVPALQGLAMCAAAGSDSKKTAEVLTRLVRLTPRDAFAHHNLGYALLQQQNFRPAARHFDAALKLNPKMVAAHNGLADALLGLGRTDQALRQTQEALRLDPGNPSALSRLKRLTRSGR
jgi:Flp pilus assembly protein TadD